MKLTPQQEADHAQWIAEVLTRIDADAGAEMDDLTSARIKSALQHAEILKRSMAEKETA